MKESEQMLQYFQFPKFASAHFSNAKFLIDLLTGTESRRKLEDKMEMI